MALEIKGLGNIVQQARKDIATLRSESVGLSGDVRAMIQSVQDVRKQVNAAHDDLKFEASTLGNMPPEATEESPADSPGSQVQPFRDGTT